MARVSYAHRSLAPSVIVNSSYDDSRSRVPCCSAPTPLLFAPCALQGLLVAAKVINIQVPFFFKDIVDTLSIVPTAGVHLLVDRMTLAATLPAPLPYIITHERSPVFVCSHHALPRG